MWPIPQELVELEALIAELRAENRAMHEALIAERALSARLCAWANDLQARRTTLAARTWRLLRLAKWWRAPGRKPTSEHVKEAMMIRYVARGGLARGHGNGIKMTVAKEFGVSCSTVERTIRAFKAKLVTRVEAHRIIERQKRQII